MATRKTVTLVADAAQDVALAGNTDMLEVLSLGGTEPVYYRVDGTAATVGGDDCFVAAAGGGDTQPLNDHDGAVTVSVISAAAQDVHVGLRSIT